MENQVSNCNGTKWNQAKTQESLFSYYFFALNKFNSPAGKVLHSRSSSPSPFLLSPHAAPTASPGSPGALRAQQASRSSARQSAARATTRISTAPPDTTTTLPHSSSTQMTMPFATSLAPAPKTNSTFPPSLSSLLASTVSAS